MRKYGKIIAKQFTSGFGKFISILAIIALGVGFLVGVLQVTPDMEDTMDRYLTENGAYDLSVKAATGLTEEDTEEIVSLCGEDGKTLVSSYVPVISTDAEVSVGAETVTGRLIQIGDGTFENQTINKLTVIEGRLPGNAGEVVAEQTTNKTVSLSVGDTVTVGDADGALYGDVYCEEEFTVVGIVSSPDYYYQDSSEQTSLGTGTVGCILYVYDGVYDLTAGNFQMLNLLSAMTGGGEIVCTDLWLVLGGSGDYEHFTDAYKSYVLEQADFFTALGEERCESLNSILSAYGQSESAQWYVLDRASTNVSYVSYAMNVTKVQDIAGVFPVFFIVVAALVAFTSMTRMVEEERGQIGALKSLGYGSGTVVLKYMVYSVSASLIGCAVGIALGVTLIPTVIWAAYKTLYSLPALVYSFSPVLFVCVLAAAVLSMAAVTVLACFSSMRESPAALLQTRAPKPGKRILLERVTVLWKPLSFRWKTTIRNVFRYKKNMILTIISVAGCTALILTGFGLNDSVVAASDIQYSEIILYESVITLSGDESEGESALESFLEASDGYLYLYSDATVTLRMDGGSESVSVYVVENDDEFSSFVSLHTRKKSREIRTEDLAGVVLPENITSVYGLSAGDTVTLGGVETEVSAVMEGYTGTSVYIGADAYETLFGGIPEANTVFVLSSVGEDGTEEAARTLLSDDAVSGVEFVYASVSIFENLSDMMGYIIAILVFFSGALAAVVLYNLTNITIDERRREIATLRVLGYRKGETAGYIYRESGILTIAGALIGLLLGFLLHKYIVTSVSSVSMMFGQAIGGLSYLWAFLITVAFAAAVYAFMMIKLNGISMADSLKSNE